MGTIVKKRKQSGHRWGLVVLATLALLTASAQTAYHLAPASGRTSAGLRVNINPQLPHITLPAVPKVQGQSEVEVPQRVRATSPAPAPSTGTGDLTMAEMDAKRITYLLDQAIALEKRETARQQIEIYLTHTGSPMQGMGAAFVANGERTSIPPALSVAISAAESTVGKQCYNGQHTHNAWGMIGFPSGWPTWEEGIAANFDFLVRHFGCPQNMSQCPGYCQGNTTMQTVNNVQRYIEGIVP